MGKLWPAVNAGSSRGQWLGDAAQVLLSGRCTGSVECNSAVREGDSSGLLLWWHWYPWGMFQPPGMSADYMWVLNTVYLLGQIIQDCLKRKLCAVWFCPEVLPIANPSPNISTLLKKTSHPTEDRIMCCRQTLPEPREPRPLYNISFIGTVL